MTQGNTQLEGEASEQPKNVKSLTDDIESMRLRIDELWRSNCAHMIEWDLVVAAKDEEIAKLRLR